MSQSKLVDLDRCLIDTQALYIEVDTRKIFGGNFANRVMR